MCYERYLKENDLDGSQDDLYIRMATVPYGYGYGEPPPPSGPGPPLAGPSAGLPWKRLDMSIKLLPQEVGKCKIQGIKFLLD